MEVLEGIWSSILVLDLLLEMGHITADKIAEFSTTFFAQHRDLTMVCKLHVEISQESKAFVAVLK